ncbi:MAG: tRNA lysidine(34) synthetase TilS [Bacteroidetes bacterium]|nr:tRNA lysidine(34) synthetase TilS [Bacteroidota bacterium]MDA0878941.1 tRNA lysidine(34) synthetase TilS [Bacteroidota bacterium]MDA1115072.1 tRNA lysidine(34) synthetase TilS [Bacteroidota bacterium]
MISQFKAHVTQLWPNIAHQKSLLALSGGLDSVVLAHLWHSCQWPFEVAHCNFKLRGEESDGDAEFVRSLCNSWGITCHATAFDTKTFAHQHKLSTQEAARNLRYDYFNQLSESKGFEHILTAHHKNDQFETFLINTLRGTGLKGLTGIPTQNGKVIRPLLVFSREEVLTYAQENNLKWREDASNQSTHYLRNAIRLKVMPELLALRPHLLEEFGQTLEHLQAAQAMVESHLLTVRPHLIRETSNGFELHLEAWRQVDNQKTYLFYLLSPFGFHQWDDIIQLMEAQSGKIIYSDTHKLLKDRSNIFIEPRRNITTDKLLISNRLDSIKFADNTLSLQAVSSQELSSFSTIYVDADLLEFPLILRLWELGDRFHPTGMTGSKKVSKYLKDELVSMFDKSRQWVLCSGGKIVWLVGRRADERFVVNSRTKNILKLTIT